MPDRSVRNLIALVIEATVVYAIYIPLLCYHFFKFYQLRRKPFIQHRYPTLIMLCSACIIALLSLGSLCGFLYVNVWDNQETQHQVLFVILLLLMAAGSLYTHGTVIRIWLMFYSVRVNKATLNDAWQSIINSNANQVTSCMVDNVNGFFLQNRATYGNYHWCIKKLRYAYSTDIICLVTMGVVFASLDDKKVGKNNMHTAFGVTSIILCVSLFVFPLVGIVVIYQYIPDFYDTFHMRRELLFVARIYLAILPLFLVLVAGFGVDQYLQDRESADSDAGLIIMTADWLLVSFVLFFAAYSMLKRFPDKLSAEYYQSANNAKIKSAATFSSVGPNSPSTTDFQQLPDDASNQKVKRIKLKDVLKEKKSFEVFIEHLVTEYSVESLLSVVEITQYREYILLCEPTLKQRYELLIQRDSERTSRTYTNTLSLYDSSDIARTESMEPSVERTQTAQSKNNEHEEMKRYRELPRDVIKSEIVYPGFYSKENMEILAACAASKQTEQFVQEHMIEDKNQRIQRYKEIAYGIFDKYIRIGSEYEININYGTRNKYMSLMGRKDTWMNDMPEFDENELVVLFQDCYTEMINLMDQSFSRFKHSDKFEQVRAVFKNA